MATTRTKTNSTKGSTSTPNSRTRKTPASQDSPPSVEARAYEIWVQEGRPDGKALEHWLQAEQETLSRRPATSRSTQGKPRNSEGPAL